MVLSGARPHFDPLSTGLAIKDNIYRQKKRFVKFFIHRNVTKTKKGSNKHLQKHVF